MKIKIITTILALLFILDCAFSQTDTKNPDIQDSLSKLSDQIWKQKTDSSRLQANTFFFKKFQTILESKSIDNAFDSIFGITRVASVDGNLRIFTWNVPLSDGTNKYFGFILLKRDSLIVIPLQSKENNITDLDTRQLTPEKWYGAIYYKLVEVEIGGQKAYTLLGWDGYTTNSNRKFIDILFPDKNGDILFGLPVFKTDKGIKSRIVLEYAEKANMLLRYDYQAIMVEKKNKIKKINTWLIVMDRMVPMDPSMEGLRKYYIPTGDTYDGFLFKNGYWTLIENIDVVNESNNSR